MDLHNLIVMANRIGDFSQLQKVNAVRYTVYDSDPA